LADHIFEGNVVDWDPPQSFTHVRTGLEYVPSDRRPFLSQRLLRDVVEPGGRLIAAPVSHPDLADTVAAFVTAGVAEPSVSEASNRNGKRRYIVWAERSPTSGITERS
jgi:hypothetical protein